MSSRAIRVRFADVSEVRMGSPYNVCRVVLSGQWVPDLPDDGSGFQDRAAWSTDGDFLGLVQWAAGRNEPGFRVLIVDVQNRTLTRSRRIAGCCTSLIWSAGGFEYQALRHVSRRIVVS